MAEQEPRTDSTGSYTSREPSLVDQAVETPQAAPAVGRGPDSHSLPRSIEGRGGQTDWQAQFEEERARRQGTDRRLQQERDQWTQMQQEWESRLSQMEKIVQKLQGTPQGKDAGPSPQKPQAPSTPQASQPDALEQGLAAIRAIQYRDALLEQMTKPGGELEDVRGTIDYFVDQIEAIPPTYKDGALDHTGQRQAILKTAERVRALQQRTQQQTQETMMRGQTPGSSPGQPPDNSAAQLYEEFTDIMQLMASDEWDNKLSRQEQQQLEGRYLELLENEQIQNMHEGQTRPSMDWSEMQNTLRQLVRKISVLEGRPPQMI